MSGSESHKRRITDMELAEGCHRSTLDEHTDWTQTADRRITRPLDRLSRKGIEVVCDEVTRIDPETRRIQLVECSTGDDPLSRPLGGHGEFCKPTTG